MNTFEPISSTMGVSAADIGNDGIKRSKKF
jgi:hypothetical protein